MEVSLTDETLFASEKITGHRQVADAYLLGLALRRGGRVVSFDQMLPWQALAGGSPDPIELLRSAPHA